MGTLRSGDAFASPLPAPFSQRQLYLTNNLLRKSEHHLTICPCDIVSAHENVNRDLNSCLKNSTPNSTQHLDILCSRVSLALVEPVEPLHGNEPEALEKLTTESERAPRVVDDAEPEPRVALAPGGR